MNVAPAVVRSTLRGVVFLVLGLLVFSLQDLSVKFIGGHYPVLEIVTFRSLVAVPLTLLLFRYEGGRGWPTTTQHTLQYIRGGAYFLSYTTHFMGLAALPLGDVAAIRFSGPLMITLLSVLFLAEKVRIRSWVALLVGFVGTLLVVHPGMGTFNIGTLFIIVSVFFYAVAVILTRKLQSTDSSATMAYYSSLVYLVATAVLTPIVLAIGETPHAHPSFVFLMHAWVTPSLTDWLIMSGLGFVWAGGMYLNARAYSIAPASVVAPFEYSTLPINVLWGFILWHEFPTLSTWAGAGITIASGLYIFYASRHTPAAAQAATD